MLLPFLSTQTTFSGCKRNIYIWVLQLLHNYLHVQVHHVVVVQILHAQRDLPHEHAAVGLGQNKVLEKVSIKTSVSPL